MNRLSKHFAVALPLCIIIGCGSSAPPDTSFRPEIYTSASGDILPYRISMPEPYDQNWSYPLVLFLHGGAGAGTDNISQISHGNRSGSHIWLTRQNKAKHPAFVVAPQLPGLERWDDPGSESLSENAQLTIELVQDLLNAYSIDPTRLYITGQSRGGWGVWDIIMKRPELFAAAIPICGGGQSSHAARIRNLPIWAFHGRLDKTVPVERSRRIVAALQELGSNVRYTEYRFAGHVIWDKVYAENRLVDWLFAQSREN